MTKKCIFTIKIKRTLLDGKYLYYIVIVNIYLFYVYSTTVSLLILRYTEKSVTLQNYVY